MHCPCLVIVTRHPGSKLAIFKGFVIQTNILLIKLTGQFKSMTTKESQVVILKEKSLKPIWFGFFLSILAFLK